MPSLRIILSLSLCLVACSGPASRPAPEPLPGGEQGPEQEPAPSPPRPWTESFLEPAVLVAREVSVEGPAGLLEHLALQVDPQAHVYEVKTTEQGLLQELTFKGDGAGGVLRAQLDQLVIAAQVRIRVLERPGDVPVIVTASGNASWTSTAGAEKRGERLRLSGAGPR